MFLCIINYSSDTTFPTRLLLPHFQSVTERRLGDKKTIGFAIGALAKNT